MNTLRGTLGVLSVLFCTHAQAAADVALAAVIDPSRSEEDVVRPVRNRNVRGSALRIADREFRQGVGVEADALQAIALHGATRFVAKAGVDDVSPDTAVWFEVIADGRSLWHREVASGQPAVEIDLDVTGRTTLVLVAEEVGNHATRAAADWVDGRFVFSGRSPEPTLVPRIIDEAPYVLTPPPPSTPRINGARVFGVRPGSPFLFTIPATGDRPLTFAADGLPEGLRLDPANGRITGVIPSTGTFKVTLRATNRLGTDQQPLRIECGENLALTPPMGWNSWNCWGEQIDQAKVLLSARAMVDRGLVNHGWTYVNIDDAWQGDRRGEGHALQANAKFPDMARLCAEIHALGLKAGLYSTPWVTSYAKYPGGSTETADGAWTKFTGKHADYSGTVLPFAIGRHSFAAADARQWAQWGFDFLKYDWGPNEVPETQEMATALRQSGRDIVYSLSNSAPRRNAAALARLAQMWRTTGDIRDTWVSVLTLALENMDWREFSSPGHWNDPDMLVIGGVGGPWAGGVRPTRLTPSEQYSHLTMWVLQAAPLLIGCPLEQADDFTLNLLTNDEVIAVDQDELGRPAVVRHVDGRMQVWVRELADGSRAVGLFNFGREPQELHVTWAQLGEAKPQRVRDVWRQRDLRVDSTGIHVPLRRHGCTLLRLWPVAR